MYSVALHSDGVHVVCVYAGELQKLFTSTERVY